MTPREFFDAVAAMRAAQRKYFATRNHDDLTRAKNAETAVDREIDRAQRAIAIREGRGAEQTLFDINQVYEDNEV